MSAVWTIRASSGSPGAGAYYSVAMQDVSTLPTATRSAHYEMRVLTLPPRSSRQDVRQLLTEHAEYGRWELARLRLYAGGERKVWLRRKIYRVRSTL